MFVLRVRNEKVVSLPILCTYHQFKITPEESREEGRERTGEERRSKGEEGKAEGLRREDGELTELSKNKLGISSCTHLKERIYIVWF
ncbi:hypothetical protein HNY73_019590 [Argiope bruennichi]|uniref:Uncharacterized protein n=1 Tax=Argiope bruennichi TaxID=94029 RepID=A0A8T0E566_ARGBR|nr:hypothetical protein HNY73_019590 [Argiope bruennichi]